MKFSLTSDKNIYISDDSFYEIFEFIRYIEWGKSINTEIQKNAKIFFFFFKFFSVGENFKKDNFNSKNNWKKNCK